MPMNTSSPISGTSWERVAELLDRTQKLKTIEDKTDTKKSFAGELKDLSIVELVQMLNLNKKSGVLKIEGKGSGEIYLQGGQLIGAKSGDQEGEEAIYELVTYEKGTFNFEVSDEEFPNNIKSGTKTAWGVIKTKDKRKKIKDILIKNASFRSAYRDEIIQA